MAVASRNWFSNQIITSLLTGLKKKKFQFMLSPYIFSLVFHHKTTVIPKLF